MISLSGLKLDEWEPASKILRGVVDIFESTFPERIASYCVIGSYHTGDRVPTSDLDLYIIFRAHFQDDAEVTTARRLGVACAAMSSILLEIRLLSETGLQRLENVGAVLTLTHGGTSIYGTDVRPQLPVVSPKRYADWVMHVPYGAMALARPHLDVLSVPLDFPDPDGTFYGYDQTRLPIGDGPDQPSTKLLVTSVGWIATALAVQRTGAYISSKGASVAQYRAVIADEWSELVEEVHGFCRTQLAYRIPDTPAGQTHVRNLCRQALAFQNHFLAGYRSYLLRAMQGPDLENQYLAVHRLGKIMFHDRDVEAALRALSTCADGRLRHAVMGALQTIQAHEL